MRGAFRSRCRQKTAARCGPGPSSWPRATSLRAPKRSGAGPDRAESLSAIAVVLDVHDPPVSEAEHLEQLTPLRYTRLSPLQANDDAGPACGDDPRLSVRDGGSGDALRSVLEDRPGLVRPVSAGRVPPPEMSSRHPSPFEARVEQRHERLDVSAHGDVEGVLDALCFPRDPTCLAHTAYPTSSHRSHQRNQPRRMDGGVIGAASRAPGVVAGRSRTAIARPGAACGARRSAPRLGPKHG